MNVKSRAIVLHTLRYNDESIIAHLLTEQEGMVSMMVRVSKSAKAAVRHSLFQPLAQLEVEWNHRPTAQLQRPKAVRPALVYTSLPYDGHKLTIAFFLAEFLHAALRQEPKSEVLFQYIARSVEWLDVSERDFANFHLVFLLRLTHYLGFFPPVDDFREGDYFDLERGVFTSVRPLHPYVLPPEEARLLPQLLRMRYENMRLFRFSGEQRNRFLGHVNDYYRLHLPNFPELKSLPVLREMFS